MTHDELDEEIEELKQYVRGVLVDLESARVSETTESAESYLAIVESQLAILSADIAYLRRTIE